MSGARVRSLVGLAAALLLAGCVARVPPPQPSWAPGAPAPDAAAAPPLRLAPARYADLPGWGDDPLDGVAQALGRSCAAIPDRLPDGFGAPADWRTACAAVAGREGATLRAALEAAFVPVAVLAGERAEGLFTGYYEPTLRGSRTRAPGYETPLHRRPPDLVDVALGAFRPDLRGQRIAGRVEGGRLVPYATRAEIVGGALDGRGLDLLWVADPVDAFFLQVQGSGRVVLPDGGEVRVGYAGQNGHPYVPIGRVLADREGIPRREVTLRVIRDWLVANPDGAAGLMNANPSYVFFAEIPDGPKGAEGVTLTPLRSLAVDDAHLPYGVPLWLEAEDPRGGTLRRLVVAQDTGGAITGPVRGDLFWGAGPAAEAAAGRMRSRGRYWVLVPRAGHAGPPS